MVYYSFIRLIHLLADNLIACPRYDDARQGTDKVKEAVGKVGKGSYAEDGGLGHAAGVPGNKYGGHCDSVFSSAAQQTALIAIAMVDVSKHIAC